MAESEWGECKDCKWWQIEPAAKTERIPMATEMLILLINCNLNRAIPDPDVVSPFMCIRGIGKHEYN